MHGLRRSEAGLRIVRAVIWGGRTKKRKEESDMTNGTNGNGTHKRDVVEFPPNTPVTLAVKYATPKIGMRPGGDDYAMFTTTDNRVMFLDCEDAQKIADLGIRPGQPFQMMLRWSGKKGDAKIYQCWLPKDQPADESQPRPWTEICHRHTTPAPAPASQPAAPTFGPQPDGTFVIPPATPEDDATTRQLRDSLILAAAKKIEAQNAKAGAGAPNTPPASAKTQMDQMSNGNTATAKSAALAHIVGETQMLLTAYDGLCQWAAQQFAGRLRNEDVRSFMMNRLIGGTK